MCNLTSIPINQEAIRALSRGRQPPCRQSCTYVWRLSRLSGSRTRVLIILAGPAIAAINFESLSVKPLKGTAGIPAPFFLERIVPICEPVHICPAWRLLSYRRWGFQGSAIDAAGTRHFEPDGVVF